ncbi:MAG: ABC transporter transmembrane domain-containing protein, partial [Nocardioidaceae bacterium]
MTPLDPRLVRRSRAVRRHLVLAVVLGASAAVLIVAQAWLVSVVVADGFASVEHGIGPALAGIVGCFVARALIGWGHRVAAARAAATVKSGLRRDIVDGLLGGRPVVAQSGHVIALLGHGLDALDSYFSRYLPQLVLAVVVPVSVLVFVASIDLVSAGVMLLTLPLVPVFMWLVGRYTAQRAHARWRALGRLASHFADVVRGLPTLRAFNRAEAQTERIAQVS